MQTIRVEAVSEVQRADGSRFVTVTVRGPEGVTVLEMTIQAAKDLTSLLGQYLR
jgi:hypothetical protein